jgi:hypothetical protein
MGTNNFFVLVHGLNTSKGEFSTLEQLIFSNFPTESTKIVQNIFFNIKLNSNINCNEKSRDGIEICSGRLIKEIKEYISIHIQEPFQLILVWKNLLKIRLDILLEEF